jgi:hypothetical protein
MNQSAVEWLFEESDIPLEKFDNHEDYVKEYLSRPLRILKKAKKMERKLQDYLAIGFAKWLVIKYNEDVIYDKYSTKELLEIYKKEKGYDTKTKNH